MVRMLPGVIAVAAGGVVAWLILLILASGAFGWRPTVLTSGSMGPHLRPGDVVLSARPDREVLDDGAVVVFRDPDGRRVTHRIVGGHPDGGYSTKGDANAEPDSTPLSADRVVGRARLLVPGVGLPYVWWTSGAWGHLLVVAVAGLALGSVAWITLRRRAPARSPRPRRSPRRAAVEVAAVPALAAVALSLSSALPVDPPILEARAAFSAAAANGSSSFSAAATFNDYYLKTEGAGDRTSTPVLPLTRLAPVTASLPNYDTDRDAFPGLLIAKGNGMGETNPAKYQHWDRPLTSDLVLSGPATFRFWSALKDFDPSKRGAVAVGLYDCNGTKTACTLLASQSLSSPEAWSGGSSTWVEKTANFASLNWTITAGRVLRVKLVVLASSQHDMWFAYDTTAYPSRLEVA